MQRRYDSYQTNMKMGREVEALDALLQGITTYDTVNADAEKYEVMEEVDAIKAQILEILQTNYNLDETAARVLISNEDALSYTIALNDVINGNQCEIIDFTILIAVPAKAGEWELEVKYDDSND